MNARERFRAVMDFKPFDRLPIVEWASWWDKTIARWKSEGLPTDVASDRYEIARYFGQDVWMQDWISPRGPSFPTPAHHGAGLVAGADDYAALLPHLFKGAADTAKWQWMAEEQRRGETVLWFTVEGFFWFPRTLFGIEPHLYAFYDEPELMHRMNSDLADWILMVVDRICEICTPDFMTFAEDMSYNHGPMLSKALFDEFVKPYYARVIPRLKERGILAIVDSDGDVTVPAGWFEDAGLDGILPLERQAGVDVAALRAAHPKMRFVGCFDKMTMSRGEDAMRAEFERLLPTAAAGGLAISCDHQTPPGVSLEDYRLYMRLFREYAVKAAGA